MTIKTFISALVLAATASAAFAEDIPTQEPNEKCFSIEGMAKYYKKMSSLKPARMDTLEAQMSAKLVREDETLSFPKIWTRSGGVDTALRVEEDGAVPEFHSVVKTLPKTAELCGEVLTPTGEEPKIGMSMDSDVLFKNRTGPYSLAELQDGVADGKSFYKKMFGGPMALLVPKMTHVSLAYMQDDTPLDVTFTQAGQTVSPPPIETFGGTYVISLEDIEASGADTMAVGGGAFKLIPSPSVKKMKQLGFSEGDDEDGAKDD